MDLRVRAARFALLHGGRPLPRRALEPLRDFLGYAMGLGSGYLGVASSGETRVVDRMAALSANRDAATILDVGGYQGDYSAAVREAFGPRATVHVFEPNPALFTQVERRFADDPNTFCHEVALSREAGSATLYENEPGSSRGSLEPDSFALFGEPPVSSHHVGVRTLDELATEVGIDRIDLLKLDVEGHEVAVLEGAATLLGEGRIDGVQFEFGEADIASRTFLRDFFQILGDRYAVYRVAP